MNVFVTGGTGFIGTYLVRRLLAEGFGGQAVTVYCLARDSARLAEDLRDRVKIVSGALQDLPQYREVLRQCEYVFHLAANAALADRTGYQLSNVEGTRALLEGLKEAVCLKRLVYTSTIGAVDRLPADACTEPLSEEAPTNPLSEYGRSKLAGENLICQSGLPFAIIRPTWVYGPGMRGNSHIRVFIDAVQKRKAMAAFHFPGRVSVVHVSDLVESLCLAAEHPASVNQTYFVSDGRPIALAEIFRLIGTFTGRKAAWLKAPAPVPAIMQKLRSRLPLTAQGLYSDVLCASNGKIASIGFRPRVDFEKGLIQTIHWHNRLASGTTSADKCRSLVTGAASGIGRSIAMQMFASGKEVLLVDRDVDRLAEVAEMLQADSMQCDLTDEGELEKIRDHLERNALVLDWVVNCAGAGLRGPVEKLSYASQRRLLDLNAWALVFLSKLALEQFRQNGGRGVLINVASSAAFQPLPYMAVYAASKAFVLSFGEALGQEVQGDSQIRVLTVCPSGTATNFQSAAGVKVLDGGKRLMSPDIVATQIIKRAKGSGTVYLGFGALGMSLLSRLLPRNLSARVWRRLMSDLR